MKRLVDPALSTNIASVHRLVQPDDGPTDRPSITIVTAIDKDQLPSQSICLNSLRARAFFSASSSLDPRFRGRTVMTTKKATTIKMSWNQKRARHPKLSLIHISEP